MDFKHSFTYFIKERYDLEYFALAAAIFLKYVPAIGSLAYLILFSGFFCVLANYKIANSGKMVNYNVAKIFTTGCKYFVYLMIFIFIASSIIRPMYLNYVKSYVMLGSTIPVGNLIACSVLVVLILVFLLDLVGMSYIDDLKFSSFFNFKKIHTVLVENFVEYIQLFINKILVLLPAFLAYKCLSKVIISDMENSSDISAYASTASGLMTLLVGISLPIIAFVLTDLSVQFLRKIKK